MAAEPPAGTPGSSHLSQALAPALGTRQERALASLAQRLPREGSPARAAGAGMLRARLRCRPRPPSSPAGGGRSVRGDRARFSPWRGLTVLARGLGGALGSVSLPPSVWKRALGPVLALPAPRPRPSLLPVPTPWEARPRFWLLTPQGRSCPGCGSRTKPSPCCPWAPPHPVRSPPPRALPPIFGGRVRRGEAAAFGSSGFKSKPGRGARAILPTRSFLPLTCEFLPGPPLALPPAMKTLVPRARATGNGVVP